MKTTILIGAGFSYDLGMPLSSDFTETFLSIYDKNSTLELEKKLSSNQPFGEGRPINRKAINEGLELILNYKNNNGKNYEELLAKLQDLEHEPRKTQSDKDSYYYLFSSLYKIIHHIFCFYQIASYQVLYPVNSKFYANFRDILNEKETWVFSLNHDNFIEMLCSDLQIPLTYGDSNRIEFPIDNRSLDKKIKLTFSYRENLSLKNSKFFSEKFGINLIKLHGGLSELEYQDKKKLCNIDIDGKSSHEIFEEFLKIDEMAYYQNGKRIPSGKDMVITNSYGELDIISKSMLTGGKKYSKTLKIQKGEEKLSLFNDVLNNTTELLILGYGFGDKHINFRIADQLAKNSNFSIRIIDPVKTKIPESFEAYDYDNRIKRAFCGAPVWFDYSKTEKWNSLQINELKKTTQYRSEIKEIVRKKLFK
ncbi:hypothetical protein LPTSP3_g14970 [Leptospira kobayashii]|uniref:SIR2-like domain-containing protein n=1 Tax=Leptospira kobayashii TaxID=1917830 RepID=A0ABN6KGB1_9LEPT|nr:hypothetical protein [Leptospira kobayashii]BDA78567.1 hypothetical protein LPTSP3_g14970 [Leptospira kobayashii]